MNMNKKILILLVSLVIFGSSCSKFLAVNEVNPNNASAVPPKLLLPAALNNVAVMLNTPGNYEFVYLWYGLWSISSGYSQPTALVQYKLLNSSYQGPFNSSYAFGQNLTEIEKASTDPKDVYYLATANILKALLMANLVDCWGDVPYTEAFKSGEGILKPKYDKQQAIYDDLILKLDAAIKLIQNAPADANAIPASSDIMYGGNMALWAKFANTLKLRMLVHQSGMSGRDAYIKTAIATTASTGYIGVGQSALVNPGYVQSSGKMNPFYERYYSAAGTQQSDGVTYHNAGRDAVDFMNSAADPRIGRFFNPYSGTSYAGNFLGQAAPPLTATNTSKLGYSATNGKGYMVGTFDKSCPILTDFESLLVQAEATERGYLTGTTAKTLYNSAIAQSFVYMGLSSAAAAAYVATDNASINYDLASNKINLILTQKWISLNGIAPIEIWTDYRRSGVPSFLHFSEDAAKQNATPPVRLFYPQREIDYNNDNVLLVGTINAFTSKIFWQNR
jgi:hypothetical protein